MAKSTLTTHFLVTVCGIVALSRTVYGGTGDKEVCEQWADIARKVTGSGKFHNCTTREQTCTVMDCSGATKFSHKLMTNDISISYCFGMQINSCNDPLSMDFYFQVSSKNATMAYRVVDDEEFAVKELNYSVGSLGAAYPVFNLVFERNTDSTVNISVTGQVKIHTSQGDIPLPAYKFTLIDDMVIPIKQCDKIIIDSSKTAPKSFVNDKCQPKSVMPISTVNSSASEKPSDTLNKTCSLDKIICGQKEMCNLLSNPPKCICNSDFHLSPKGDACVSKKRNQTCVQNIDCDGSNEECRADSSKTLTCQCKEHYTYNSRRDMCTLPEPEDEMDVSSHQTYNQSHSTPSGTGSSENVKASSSAGNHNIPIFVGGGLAAAVVIGLAIWGVACYLQRRRRPHLSINERECSSPMIGNADSDNLIM